jgi:uncharacterized protein (TIGR03437 family)
VEDLFVARIDPGSASLEYSTLLGGEEQDLIWEVGDFGIDEAGAVYLVGETSSPDFPTTPNALDRVRVRGFFDIFVTRLDTTRDASEALTYSTFLGGEDGLGVDILRGFLLDAENNVLVTGQTSSTTFPITPITFDDTCGSGVLQGRRCGDDIFVSKIRPFGGDTLEFRPESLEFRHQRGEEPPPSQTLTFTTSRPDLVLQTVVSSDEGWLSISERVTIIGTSYVVSVDPGSLVADTYEGRIVFKGGAPPLTRSVDVTLVVEPGEPVFTTEGVVSAAGFRGGPIAPGQIISIFGSGLGPREGAVPLLDGSSTLPTHLAGTRVTIDRQNAALLYAGFNQINLIAPYFTRPGRDVPIVIHALSGEAETIFVRTAPSAPGLFTSDGTGLGNGAILNEDFSLNLPANPAERGSIIVVFGTGEGATDPPGRTGQLASDPLPRPVLPVQVRVGGVEAEVLFAGAAPGFAGLLQLNVRVPSAPTAGDAVPIELQVGDATSQSGVTVAIE